MAGPTYIIDGYNLLHKLPELAGVVCTDAELARERLVGRVAGWRGGRNVSVTIVFDGTAGTYQVPRASAGVKVAFSRSPGNADAHITSFVARHESPRSVVVVTSDNGILRSVRDSGAKTLSSEEFAAMLTEPPEKGRAGRAEKRELNAAEVADWEQYFRERKPEEHNLWTPPRRRRGRR